MPSIIVPAHNEATVIRACLDSLLKQAGVDRIIVACNGCTDNTAAIVQQEYPQVICLDLPTPSKVNALNEAEKQVVAWPVFYIDADTKLSAGAVQTITEVMSQGSLLLAAPEPVIDTSRSSWLVQQYYKVWLSLPYIREGVVATCSFVLSATGRQRFTQFPQVINDDGFVRCQFAAHERGNVSGTQVFIQAPHNLKSLIKIKTRARLGNLQLAAANLCTQAQEKPYSHIMRTRLFSKDFLAVGIYLLIASLIRLRAKQQFKHLANYRWETDHSSRQTSSH
ncbi:Glycosyltransferase involved in cell wall bisynthesis [Thiothrix eikelboomii]|uniref:Glycosyltransferase involved in cell wall bisynthesis n=1 Tax=Thiothrix eikelboomii TaxID=92487 RepID=A0A1T4XSS2_9GAMM|nr:glycosyltransferase family 2 protein [Thiothrix eikelboomii]SKA92609.1 Glycosyltransferase involved in cell wall bisynthesis [Thiothrix eikelboomii]